MKFILKPLIILLMPLALITDCEKSQPEINELSCLERCNFGNPAESQYILPFPEGKSYILSQSYCNPDGGHSNQLAYDFAMQIGDTVISMRAGEVMDLREDQPDTGGDIEASNHNYLMIRHDDGSVAFYAHLKYEGVLVEKGNMVKQGEIIALSGNSGNTLNFPHLHVGVYESWPARETYDLPFNFRNCAGPLDSNNGLIADELYTALIP